MSELTRERIEQIRRTGVYDLYEGDVDALCDLALSALTARSEGLEEGDKLLQAKRSGYDEGFREGVEAAAKVCDEYSHQACGNIVERIRALSPRETDAAPQEQLGPVDPETRQCGLATPAASAPSGEVAEMVGILTKVGRRGYTIVGEPNAAILMLEAAALLSKVGQGWVPPARFSIERSKIVRTCRKCKTSWEAPVNFCPQCGGVNDEMVDRYLSWPLPESVCADLCATKQGPGRIGTNILSATEAKQMLEYVLAHSYKTVPPPPERP